MKTLILSAALAFISISLSAQSLEVDSSTGKLKAQAVEEVSSELTKDQLYSKAKEWIALNHKSANDVIQLADKEDGKIICKGNFNSDVALIPGRVEHTMVLDFKDGKFRYLYSDLVYISLDGRSKLPFESKSLGMKKKLYAAAENNIKTSIASLKEYIAGASSASDNNW